MDHSTHYKIYDFMGFQNMNSAHMDMWGFKITEADVPSQVIILQMVLTILILLQ